MNKKRSYGLITIVGLFILLIGCSSDDGILKATIDAQETIIAEQAEGKPREATEPSVDRVTDAQTPQLNDVPTPQPTEIPVSPTPEPINEPSLILFVPSKSWAMSGHTLFTEMQDNTIEAFDLETGEVLWSSQAKGTILASDDINVYISGFDERVDALNSSIGEIRWTALLPGRLSPLSIEMTFDGLFTSTDYSGHHIFIEKESGQVFTLSDSGSFARVGNNIIVYPRGNRTTVAGFSTQSQQNVWEMADTSIDGTYLCRDILVRKYGSEVEGFEPQSGVSIWTTSVNGRTIECAEDDTQKHYPSLYNLFELLSPFKVLRSIDDNSSNIYVVPRESDLNRGLLYALDGQTGDMKWDSSDVYNDSRWLGEFENLVVYTNRGLGLTTAYSAGHHQLVWEYSGGGIRRVIGVSNKTLVGEIPYERSFVITDPPQAIVGLNVETGQAKWEHQVQQEEFGTNEFETIATVNEYVVYSTTGDTAIRFLNPETGELLYTVPTSIERGSSVSSTRFFEQGNLIGISTSSGQIAFILLP